MNRAGLLLLLCGALSATGAPALLDDQFDLPAGFHIYRAAGPELSGGSYDLCFDGQGRLLVGDGNAVRRLADKDGDGVFDSYEVIATGLGWRGPQGLLVYGTRLYAVGGDGIQLFEGYSESGGLVHKGRIGAKFSTGGDHEAHTLLRGHDGYIYFNTGDGGGAKDRLHITETSSPVLFERSASVFRISPDGARWECISAGGRNPPNLGQNYLGEFFSLDSDMEWHVGLPWYRPVRLNHWAVGGDQGWQEVGAYPPYFIDCLPGILDVGRGSPDWGVFYEHTLLPAKYSDAFLVCDYRWKRESSDDYATTGRLLAFFLKREGAGWTASMEVLARPKSGARDSGGRPISFALVDIEVAPDGSLYLSDHNQGIWRVSYGSRNATPETSAPVSIDKLLSIPQPASEWARLQESKIRAELGDVRVDDALGEIVTRSSDPLAKRLRALRLLAPGFATMPTAVLQALAGDAAPELRGQAAWLLGIRGVNENIAPLLQLLEDNDPFVRRRAAEALARSDSPEATESLIDHLADPSRLVRFVAMAALAHRPASQWLDKAQLRSHAQVRLRALVAASMRREALPEERVRSLLVPLLTQKTLVTEDRLDLLRVAVLFRSSLDAKSRTQVANYVVRNFPDPHRDIRWEQVRVLGEYEIGRAFGPLLAELESETNHVVQFHIAQALAKLPEGWTPDQQERLVRWFLNAQHGWFAEFSGKGVEFPHFWSTVLTEFGERHGEALLRAFARIDLSGLLGGVAVNLMAERPDAADSLTALYRKQQQLEPKLKIVRALGKRQDPMLGTFLRAEYHTNSDSSLRGAILQALAAQPAHSANTPLFQDGLSHKEREVARACAAALHRAKPEMTEPFARAVLRQVVSRRELYYSLEKLLVSATGRTPAEYNPNADLNRRPDEKAWGAAVDFWKQWHQQQFGAPVDLASTTEKSDDDLHRLLMTESFTAGNAVRGGRIYEALQCQTCHGGGVTPGREGRIFGPDLAGVTRRLSRQELADSLVYPSKQVADRFKAYELERSDSVAIIGFLTEQNAEAVTIVDQQQVHKVPRAEIKSLRPQSNSLMPDRVMNSLSADEIRDLLAFLDQGIGVAPANGK
jgi:putative heme-binding domain-containing protein